MRQPLQLGLELLDPRGRCNRKGLLIVATAMLAVELCFAAAFWGLGLSFGGGFAAVFKALFLWLGICACAKRLHDLDRSAGWLGWGFLGFIVWSAVVGFGAAFTLGIEALMPRDPRYLAVCGVAMAPMVAGMLWLHFAKGCDGPNRFGPAPDASGFSPVILDKPRVQSA